MTEPIHALRLKGGVMYDPDDRRWHLLAHLWHGADDRGVPEVSYTWPETYASQADAMAAYLTIVRPVMARMLEEAKRTGRVEVHHWGWEAL